MDERRTMVRYDCMIWENSAGIDNVLAMQSSGGIRSHG
jgi:hypothetical protein